MLKDETIMLSYTYVDASGKRYNHMVVVYALNTTANPDGSHDIVVIDTMTDGDPGTNPDAQGKYVKGTLSADNGTITFPGRDGPVRIYGIYWITVTPSHPIPQ